MHPLGLLGYVIVPLLTSAPLLPASPLPGQVGEVQEDKHRHRHRHRPGDVPERPFRGWRCRHLLATSSTGQVREVRTGRQTKAREQAQAQGQAPTCQRSGASISRMVLSRGVRYFSSNKLGSYCEARMPRVYPAHFPPPPCPQHSPPSPSPSPSSPSPPPSSSSPAPAGASR